MAQDLGKANFSCTWPRIWPEQIFFQVTWPKTWEEQTFHVPGLTWPKQIFSFQCTWLRTWPRTNFLNTWLRNWPRAKVLKYDQEIGQKQKFMDTSHSTSQ